jgi:ferritin
MTERDPERFDLDDDFLADQQEDSNDYDRLLDRVDKRTRDKTKKVGKAAWSKLEEVLAERRLQRDLADYDDYEA